MKVVVSRGFHPLKEPDDKLGTRCIDWRTNIKLKKSQLQTEYYIKFYTTDKIN